MTSPDLEPAITDEGTLASDEASLVARAWSLVRRGWLGLMGQGLSFLAMVMPIAFSEFKQLSALLVASAGAQVLSYTFSLGFPSVFPRLSEPSRMRAALLASVAAVTGVCVVLVVAGLALLAGGRGGAGQVALAWGGMTFAQAVYLMAAGVAVRFADYPKIAAGRLVYGACMALTTLAACLWSPTRYGLVLAASVSYLVAGLFVGLGSRARVGSTLRQGRREGGVSVLRYAASTAAATTSAALTGLASQLNLLIIPGIGVYHDVWTGLMRLSGGVTTVSMQLIAPALDIDVSRGVREGKAAVARAAVRKEVVAGVGLGLVTIVVSLPLLAVVGAMHTLGRTQVVIVSLAGVLYVIGQLSVSAMFNTLLLLGEDSARLLWAAVKSLLLLGVILLGGSYRLEGCVAVEVATDLMYLILVRRGLRGMGRTRAGRHRSRAIAPRSGTS